MGIPKTTSVLQTLALIGCGHMGGALLAGFVRENLTDNIIVVDPKSPILKSPVIRHKTTITSDLTEAQAIILAVKPQIMEDVCKKIAAIISPDTLIISIAAGTTLAQIGSIFTKDQPIIRAMPNTPAAIGRGITASIGNQAVHDFHRIWVQAIFSCVGHHVWLDNEELMNSVTAVSGSGPAYVYALIEAIAQAGIDVGLPHDLAMILARQTTIGSAALADAYPQTTASDLRVAVTSPGGTTEAALKTLHETGFFESIAKAVEAAAKRAKALGSRS